MKIIWKFLLVYIFASLGFRFISQGHIIWGLIGCVIALFWLREMKR